MKNKKILIIDGYSIFFRMFFAIPIRYSNNFPINAIVGFFKILKNLINFHSPDSLVIALDGASSNWRNELYPLYKQNRKDINPELILQLKLLPIALKKFNLSFVSHNNFEADDLIATIAQFATNFSYDSRIISCDKDFIQLISSNISLFDPFKKIEITPDLVMQKFNVSIDQFPLFLALQGDKADNIPGISGIGPKIASNLLKHYFNPLEIIEDKLGILSKKQSEKIDLENLNTSLKLVLLKKDSFVPNLQDFNLNINYSSAVEFCNEYDLSIDIIPEF